MGRRLCKARSLREKKGLYWALFLSATLGLPFFTVKIKAADGGHTIRGNIYISPSGKPEGDLVMRAAGVEVTLLRGEGGFADRLEAIRQNRRPTIEKQLQAVSRAQEEFLRSSSGQREEMEKSSAILRQERVKLAELREAYEKEVDELIAKHTFARTKTDSEGRFHFAGIGRGNYLLHAHFEVVGMDIHYYWLIPVKLETGKGVEISLNKLNARPLF